VWVELARLDGLRHGPGERAFSPRAIGGGEQPLGFLQYGRRQRRTLVRLTGSRTSPCLEGRVIVRYLSRMNKPMTPRERAARYRAGLKSRGLHQVQMIVPDLWAPAIQARLRAACVKLSARGEIEEMRALAAFSEAAWADTPE